MIFSDPFLKQSNFFSQHSYRYDNESPKREIIADILYRADKLKADHTSSCISKSLSIGDYSTVLSIIKESRTSRSLFSPDLSRMACIILDSTPQYEPKHDILLRQIEYIYKLILHKHELQLKKTDSQFIYHYTSLNTLEKLSLGSKFRAYHVEYLNDPNEGKSINSLLQSFSIDKKYPDWNLLSIPLGIFIASFINDSENSLPMWSQYGNQYTGCRLAFSSKDIPCDLYSVIYEETELKEHIDQILQTLDSYQKELETPIDYNRDPVFIFAQDIFQLLSYIYKNPAFRHEREVRLLIFSDIESSFAENTIRSNEDFPRIFKEIDLPRVDKKVSNSPIAIKEIMLGPKVVKPTWVKLSLIQRGYPPSCIHENYVPLQ
mgnify:CR=1 FL=1